MSWFLLLIHFLPYNRSPEKWRFLSLKSLLLPQFSTYRHRTGFIVQRKQVCISNYLGLPIHLLRYPSNNHTFMPSIGSLWVGPFYLFMFYLTIALLKSDVFRHSKAYSPHSFQPTGIGLGSLCRGNRCVLPIISAYLYIGKKKVIFNWVYIYMY